MMRQLAVSVSEDIWKRILKMTDEQEISISSWIREAIEKSLDCKMSQESSKSHQTNESKKDPDMLPF
jgi:hypothetical protein